MTARRKVEFPPEEVYPIEDWRMVERGFHERYIAQNETLFSLSNGYLGMRGTFEEGAPVAQHGTFVNGFHETWPIVYGEGAFGFAKTGQTMLNVPDTKVVRLYVDDEHFHLPRSRLLECDRALDMRRGTLDRNILWEMPSGRRVRIRSSRLVSLEHRHVAALMFEVTPLDADAAVALCSEVFSDPATIREDEDPRRPRGLQGRVLEIQEHTIEGRRMVLSHTTRRSKMSIACGIDHTLQCDNEVRLEGECDGDAGRLVFSTQANKDSAVRLVKFMAYHTSRGAPPSELCRRVERSLDQAVDRGFEHLRGEQEELLRRFWQVADIEIRLPEANRAQQCLRWNLFQLHQATARADEAGVGARGLTGGAYDGHYFWDTEIYVLPFLIYTQPRIARNLLHFRYRMLDQARKRAAEVNQRGALFPWRTINGEEASAYYAAGTAQYHINADIMYALKKYVDATGDDAFLWDCGAEMLIETARLWLDLGFYSDRRDGQFCIHGVTGPDEYNTIVNNNTYTNLMARQNLWYAAATLRRMADEQPERFAALVHRTGLSDDEAAAWHEAAERMYVPYDEALGIHPQDEAFLDKEPWDLEGTPPEKYPLLLHFHPLVIYRSQVIKQPDIVLAMFLLGHEFSEEQKQRNFDFYDPLTTGDSSLSACIQAITADELGYVHRAQEYMRHALLMDLADVGGNVADGVHMASVGGTWMSVVYGLLGMRDSDGRLSFHPRLRPPEASVRMHITYRDRLLRLERAPGHVSYTLEEGQPLTFFHGDQAITLRRGESEVCGLLHTRASLLPPSDRQSGPEPSGGS